MPPPYHSNAIPMPLQATHKFLTGVEWRSRMCQGGPMPHNAIQCHPMPLNASNEILNGVEWRWMARGAVRAFTNIFPSCVSQPGCLWSGLRLPLFHLSRWIVFVFGERMGALPQNPGPPPGHSQQLPSSPPHPPKLKLYFFQHGSMCAFANMSRFWHILYQIVTKFWWWFVAAQQLLYSNHFRVHPRRLTQHHESCVKMVPGEMNFYCLWLKFTHRRALPQYHEVDAEPNLVWCFCLMDLWLKLSLSLPGLQFQRARI